jgi:hypothetical protein
MPDETAARSPATTDVAEEIPNPDNNAPTNPANSRAMKKCCGPGTCNWKRKRSAYLDAIPGCATRDPACVQRTHLLLRLPCAQTKCARSATKPGRFFRYFSVCFAANDRAIHHLALKLPNSYSERKSQLSVLLFKYCNTFPWQSANAFISFQTPNICSENEHACLWGNVQLFLLCVGGKAHLPLAPNNPKFLSKQLKTNVAIVVVIVSSVAIIVKISI